MGALLAVMKVAGGGKPAEEKPEEGTVSSPLKRDLSDSVVETGTLDAVKSVDVKSRVQGRLARLLVDAGDFVQEGQLIAVIDPQETLLKVKQDRAQVSGARSSAARQAIEIEKQRVTAQANYEQALARLTQVQNENQSQPQFTNSAITQAESQLKAAQQEYQRLVKTVQPNQRTSAETSLREVMSSLELAKKDLARQEDLLRQGFVAAREVDSARNNVQVAQARVDAAKATFERLESQLDLELQRSKEQVAQAEAEVKRVRANTIQLTIKNQDLVSARNEVAKAKAALLDVQALIKGRDQSLATVSQLEAGLSDSERQLRETEIRAPFSGIVTKRHVQVGELVSALSGFSAGTPIVTLQDRASMRVLLNVNEIDAAKLTTPMKAKIKVDALPNEQFEGSVFKIAPAANTNTTGADGAVKYQVDVRVTSTSPLLKTGMTAKCTIVVKSRPNVLALSQEFVGKDGEQYFVELYDAAVLAARKIPSKESTPGKRKNIKVGLSTLSYVEILDGLTEKDKVMRPAYKGPNRKGFIESGSDN